MNFLNIKWKRRYDYSALFVGVIVVLVLLALASGCRTVSKVTVTSEQKTDSSIWGVQTVSGSLSLHELQYPALSITNNVAMFSMDVFMVLEHLFKPNLYVFSFRFYSRINKPH